MSVPNRYPKHKFSDELLKKNSHQGTKTQGQKKQNLASVATKSVASTTTKKLVKFTLLLLPLLLLLLLLRRRRRELSGRQKKINSWRRKKWRRSQQLFTCKVMELVGYRKTGEKQSPFQTKNLGLKWRLFFPPSFCTLPISQA